MRFFLRFAFAVAFLGFCCSDCAALEKEALQMDWAICGTGGAYLLVAPGELEVEVSKRDLNIRRSGEVLKAILVGPDRQVLDFFLDKLFAGARRSPPLSVVLLEVADLADHREIGGPGVGPQALSTTAEALSAVTRAMNVMGRYDEERILVLLQGEDVAGAWSFASRVLEEIESQPAPWEGRIHLNAGIACFDEALRSAGELLERVEAALTASRSLGGGTPVVFGGAHEQDLGISGMYVLQADGRLREVHRTI